MHCCISSPPYFGLRIRHREVGGWGWWIAITSALTCGRKMASLPYRSDWTVFREIPTHHAGRVYGNSIATSAASVAPAASIARSGWRSHHARRLRGRDGGGVREVWRVLRDDGTLWLNIGDSYNADGRKAVPTWVSARTMVTRLGKQDSLWHQAQGPHRHPLARRVRPPRPMASISATQLLEQGRRGRGRQPGRSRPCQLARNGTDARRPTRWF